jgi:hypothetical protein
VTLDLAHPYRAENNWQRLIKSLRADVPRMGGVTAPVNASPGR